ncbi:MAG: AHH domain-containing protein [Chloroflexota bacterium]|nr:AHH domain-containing protein [Chloroflexota bacterium]
MSFFPGMDQIAAAIDFIRSAAAGDRMGTGLALMGFLPGPNPGAFDDIVEGAARNADEVADGAQHVPVSPIRPDEAYNPLAYTPHSADSAARNRAIRSNAQALNASMNTAFEADPSRWASRIRQSGEDAHHIVPSAHQDMQATAQILTNSGVGVNSAYNGIGLGRAVHSLTYSGQTGHTYRRAVASAFTNLLDDTGRASSEQVIALLDGIAERLDDLQQYTGDELIEQWNIFIDDLSGGNIP